MTTMTPTEMRAAADRLRQEADWIEARGLSADTFIWETGDRPYACLDLLPDEMWEGRWKPYLFKTGTRSLRFITDGVTYLCTECGFESRDYLNVGRHGRVHSGSAA